MNILAITMLIIGSFIAGRVYEYRLNLNENDEVIKNTISEKIIERFENL
ncbi:hypothetical protein [Clostridioides difficile]